MSSELIIFDCDGVLVDSEPLVNRVYVELMRERGFNMDEAESLRRYAGTHMPVRLAEFSAQFQWTPDPAFVPGFKERLAQLFESSLKPVDGIEDLLAYLTEKPLPISVASNNTASEIAQRLKAAKLHSYFDGRIFGALDLGQPKPSPAVFLHAAHACGVPKERCSVIEDSVTGVKAAIAAGMRVFGYCAFTDSDTLQALGATTFHSMNELTQLLQL